jgi:hypothetical protein
MRKFITLFCLLAVCFSSCKKKQEDILADIRKKYGEINNKLKDYTRKQVDDITTVGAGTITGYYRDDEIKKLVAERFTDTCRTFTEDYFDDGMLIFMVEQNFVYNKPNTYTEEKARALGDSVWYDDKKTTMETNRFYFHKNKLIKWIDADNSDMPVNTSEFSDRQSLIWAKTAVLIKQLKEQ